MTVLFDHAGLETPSIEEDVRLYVRAFGLRRVRWGTHTRTGGRIAILGDRQGVKLELIEVLEPTGELTHLAFRSDDVVTARADAVSAGCLSDGELRRIEAADATAAMVRLPSGARVQLIRYEPGSPDLAAAAGVVQ